MEPTWELRKNACSKLRTSNEFPGDHAAGRLNFKLASHCWWSPGLAVLVPSAGPTCSTWKSMLP
jgi:hypothetical protein